MINLQHLREAKKLPAPILDFYKVPSLDNVFVTKEGHVAYLSSGKYFYLYPLRINPKGYQFFDLFEGRIKVHRIMCETFLPNPNNKPFVNHKNGIKHDNRIDNLEWCTTSENNRHSSYVLNNNSQHEKRQVKIFKNGSLLTVAASVRHAARLINGDHSNISKCCKGKRKQYIGYTFEYN